MNRASLTTVVTVAIGCMGFLTTRIVAQDNAQAGTIKGQITVSGVRDAENVLVYVEKAPGEFPPGKQPAQMDQVKLTFIPFVLPILKGTTVSFLNSDAVLHNVFWP